MLAALAYPLRAMAQQDRSAYLDWMLKSLPSAPQFAQWQQRTGELHFDRATTPCANAGGEHGKMTSAIRRTSGSI